MSSPQNKRRSSSSSMKGFTSIDEFKYLSPFDEYVRTKKFPLRPAINILIILLTTIQVYILLNSRIYLRGELVRSFLSVYVDQNQYPELFDGAEFYLQITDIQDLKTHFQYLFKRVNKIDEDSFIDYYYKNSKILLHTAYKQFAGRQHGENVHQIDPKKGIVEPFNMTNITDIQLYLLQTEQFQIQIQNLTLKQNWQGFSQRYAHDITYTFVDSIKILINFQFRISNAMVRPDDQNHDQSQNTKIDGEVEGRGRGLRMGDCLNGCYYKGQPGVNEATFRTFYSVRVRIFYGLVLIVSLISLYLNYISIRKIYNILYQQLSKNPIDETPISKLTSQSSQSASSSSQPASPTLLTHHEEQQMRSDVQRWVLTNNLTISQIKLAHYVHILEFDLIFSTLSNIFEIITAFYLVSGIERQRLAGIVCLFSWLTIFKLVRNNKKLVIMYQLIKVSIVQVTNFFLEFLPVFVSYALLGICLFPKVSFFSSLADSVTTLVCLMMGDSIQMITYAILEKNSTLLAMIYIFSFVLLFMHAIHNTLTSLIKQFFIMKKIELVHYQKEKNKETNYIYIQQLRTNSDMQKRKLPLKLSEDLRKGLLRIEALNRTKKYEEMCVLLTNEIQNVRITEKWMIWQQQLSNFVKTKEELVRRSIEISKLVKQFEDEGEWRNGVDISSYVGPEIGKDSLLTQS